MSITRWSTTDENTLKFVPTNDCVIVYQGRTRHISRKNIVSDVVECLLFRFVLVDVEAVGNFSRKDPLAEAVDCIDWRIKTFELGLSKKLFLSDFVSSE